MSDDSESSGEEEQQKLVRFRRWIAMTPDSKWREFRGTADMVDVGKDGDLVELVDSMMLARISHFDQMMDGWKIMRSGLTPNNAAAIYAEMMNSLTSLMQFEMENFTKTNSWTQPKNQAAFPRYLSDCPVRDGGTLSAITSGQSQLMVRFVESDSSSKHEEYLRALFGDFVPKQLMEMLEECNDKKVKKSEVAVKEKVLAPTGNFEGTSRDFLAQGVRPTAEEDQPLSTPSSQPAKAQNPQQPVTKVCTGLGFIFNPQNKKITMTALSNTGNTVGSGSTPSTIKPAENPKPTQPPMTVRPFGNQQHQPRPLMGPPHPSNYPTAFPPLSGPVPGPIPVPAPNSQILALLVVQQPTGETVTMGYVPVNYDTLHNPITGSYQPVPPPQAPMQLMPEIPRAPVVQGPPRTHGPFPQQQRTQRNRNYREPERVQPTSPSSSATVSSQQNDSGFSSSEQESTRGSTPSVNSQMATAPEYGPLRRNSSAATSASSENAVPSESATSSDPPNQEVPSPSEKLVLPTYASVVTMNDVNKTDRIGAATSLVVMAENPVVSVEREIEIKSAERDFEVGVVTSSEIVVSKSESGQEPDGWQVVKNKHPVLAVVISEPKKRKEERPVTVIEELSESSDELEVDEDEEKKKEIKRARRQKTRAAKAQRNFEEKAKQKKEKEEKRLAENQQLEQVQQEEGSEAHASAPEHPGLLQGGYVGNSYSANREDEQRAAVAASAAELVPEPQESSSGQRKYSDNDIIKEEEEDDDDSDEPKELQFIQCREHAKIMFRMLWFDNKGKMAHLYIDDAERRRIQSLLDMIRAMKDRVDMAGRMIVYRTGRPQISDHIEENIVKVARNLIDVTRHTVDGDMAIAKTMCELVGKMTKNFTYLNYVFSILTLPQDFFPRLHQDDPRLIGYKEIITLTQLHMKRVEKIYESLCELYEFKIEIVPKRRRRH